MGTRALTVAVLATTIAAAVVAAAPLASYRGQVLLACVGVALALHGLGRGLAGPDRRAPAALVIAWGLAGYLALGGWLAAAGALTRPVMLALGAAGLVLGCAWAAWARPTLAWPRALGQVTVVALAAAIAVVAALAAAGAHGAEFSDGDGFLPGAITRLTQRGSLDDALGLPRHLGLGGATIATALGVTLPDLRAGHAVDGGLGLALVLALALMRMRPRARSAPTYVALVLIGLIIGVPALPPDLAPRWLTVALALALYETLARPETDHGDVLAVVVATGLAALSHAGVGALIATVVVVDARRPRWQLAAVAAIGLGGYVISLARAGGGDAAWFGPGLIARAGGGVVAGVAAWAVLGLATRGLEDRALACWIAIAASALTVSLAAAPTAALAGALAAPYLITLVLLVTARALTAPSPTSALTIVVAFTIIMVPAGLRFRLGVPPRSWGDRWAELLDDVRATAAPSDEIAAAASYRAAQAAVPAGARLAVWVERPELLDYRRHDVIDLRSAAASACQGRARAFTHPGATRCRALARQRAAVAADYALISPAAPLPPDDPLVARLAAGTAVPSTSELQIVALGP